MRVLVTGGTGFIGRALVARLAASGHSAIILTRNLQVTQRGRPGFVRPHPLPPGAAAMPWNPPDPVPAAALEGVDAVLHLAGANVGAWPWTAARKREIRDSRVLGTRALVDSLRDAPARPRALVAMSGVGYYGDAGDRLLREADPPGAGFLSDVVRDWEREIFAAETLGVRTVSLRSGVVLGRGGALAKMRRPFALGLGAVVGSGRQYLSWIHLDDAVGAILHALGYEGLRGPCNLSAEPATNRAFSAALARALGRPLLFRAPAWAVRAALGEMGKETLLASQRASSEKLLASGYRLCYPGLEACLKDILGG